MVEPDVGHGHKSVVQDLGPGTQVHHVVQHFTSRLTQLHQRQKGEANRHTNTEDWNTVTGTFLENGRNKPFLGQIVQTT